MRRFQIALLAVLAIASTACGKAADSSGGFIGAWRQFLELDSPSASAELADRASATGAPQTHAGLIADIQQITEQIRVIYGDATSFIDGFPQAEETYRSIPTKFKEQVDKIRENKGNADAATVQRRLAQLASQATEVIDRQHTRFTTLQSTFNQRMEPILKRAPELEQTCTKIQGSASPDQAQACTRFLDANSMVKTKADLVIAGFTRLEGIYQETRQAQQQLAAQLTGSAAK